MTFNWFGQARLVQPSDGVSKRPDAGQHHLVGGGHLVGIAADLGLLDGQSFLESLLHAAEIGHPIIDDQDRLHQRFSL